MKVVINKCYGGFGLSQAAYVRLIELGVPVYKADENRPDDEFAICDFADKLTPGSSLRSERYYSPPAGGCTRSSRSRPATCPEDPVMELISGLVPARGVWWRPANRQERLWIAIAFVWCLVLFAMMPFWHLKGGQNPTGIRSRVDPAAFAERTLRFAEEYGIGDDHGVPLVAPPPGAEVYLLGREPVATREGG